MDEFEKSLAEAKDEDEEYESRIFWTLIQERKECYRQGIAVGLSIMATIISVAVLAIHVLLFLYQ